MLDEAFVYVTITNPCTVSGVINSQTISDISYSIKDSKNTRTVSLYTDSPSVRDGGKGTGNGYLHTNPANVCGAKSYAIVMADKSANTNSAYHNLNSDFSTCVYIETYTTDPVYVTNANVQYYLRVTLDDYYTSYTATARDDGYNLNMVSCVLTSGGSAFPNKASDKVDTYILYTPVRKYDYALWTTACDSTVVNGASLNYKNNIEYSVKVRTWYDALLDISDFSDGTRTPFVVWNTGYSGTPATASGTPSFWIQSDTTIDVTTERQTYIIELTGCTSTSDQNAAYCETQKLTITIVNECPDETLTNTLAFISSSYTYYIN